MTDQSIRAGDGISDAAEREAFEAFVEQRGGNRNRHLNDRNRYASATVQGWWKALQARAALAAAPAAAPAWQPIETAPKDGTAILLGSRGGSWIGKWLPVYVSGYRPDNPWSSLMLNHDHMGEKWCVPTHWMPLPGAPGFPSPATGDAA